MKQEHNEEKITVICISPFFILLLALQFNGARSNPVFAQLEEADVNNINLNGIWERIDGDPYEDIVYIEQEGSTITATWREGGACYEDPYNRTDETRYAPHKLVFRGNLIGYTIQGEVTRCFSDERTAELQGLSMRVSTDGRTLDDGSSTFILTSSMLPSTIEIDTDKPVYYFEESVEISGRVTNMVDEESDVFIEVYGPDGQQAFSKDDVLVNPDGSFSTSFNLDGDNINNGTYTAVASYPGANDQTTFEVGTRPLVPPEVAIATGATIAAGGAVLLYKKGYLKGIKHGGDVKEEQFHKDLEATTAIKPEIIKLRIEYGLENFGAIKRESSESATLLRREVTEIEQRFSQTINAILESRSKLKEIEKDIEFVKWCQKAKEDPDKILSKMSEEIIGKFLSSIEPYFQNLMLSQISVESDISVTEDRPKRIKKNITFNLTPIQAYIELIIYSNEVRISSTKFIFTINSYVKIKNLTVYLVKLNRYHQGQQEQQDYQLADGNKSGNNNDSVVGGSGTRRRIEIENLVFGISVELSKMKIGLVEKTIQPPLKIGTKEAEIKNILFSRINKN